MLPSSLWHFKIWDLRTYRCLHVHKLDKPATSVDISDRDLLAVGMGREVQIFQDAFTSAKCVTYLKHSIRAPSVALCSVSL